MPIQEAHDPITQLQVAVPSELFFSLRETQAQFAANMKRLTAMSLFQSKRLSIGQSAALADMNEEDFIFFLGQQGVSIFDVDMTTLEQELAHG